MRSVAASEIRVRTQARRCKPPNILIMACKQESLKDRISADGDARNGPRLASGKTDKVVQCRLVYLHTVRDCPCGS